MRRAVYRCVILLHPPAFRRRFADEMLWIFEEAAKEANATALLTDGLTSLVRQWSRSPTVWKIAAIGLGNAPFLIYCFWPQPPIRNSGIALAPPDFFLVAVLAPLVAISMCLIFAVSWLRFVRRRRL